MNAKGKILIIDDNEDVLFALNLLLEPYVEKIKVTTQPTRIEHFMTTFQPDVILLDMNFRRDAISGQEGFNCLEQILKLDPQAIVLFMTAYADTDKAVRAIKAGAIDFIPKPWEKEKLLATLSSAIKLRDSRKDLNVRMINNEKLLPTLTATSVYNAISNTIDREGEGTVSLTYSLYPKDIKKKTFKKSNMYWSTKDISSRSVDEIYNVLDILSENRFEKYDIRQIQVDMSVTKERKTAQILDATATPMIVSPGDTIYIKARLQAYRGDIFYKELTFRVPDDQPYGKMILEIRGGGVTPLPYLIEQQKYNLSDEILDRLRVYKDFDHLQKVLLNENQNNQIVVEILDPNVSMIAKDETSGSSTEIQGKKIITKPEYLHEREKKTQQNEDKNSSKSYVNTDYVIYGDGQFSFTVLPPDKREEALKQMVKKQKELIAEMYREQQSSDLINEEESSD